MAGTYDLKLKQIISKRVLGLFVLMPINFLLYRGSYFYRGTKSATSHKLLTNFIS